MPPFGRPGGWRRGPWMRPRRPMRPFRPPLPPRRFWRPARWGCCAWILVIPMLAAILVAAMVALAV